MSPAISCIVTAYNEGDMARLSLDSLLTQTFDDVEVLVVDDGASPETRTILQSYDDPRITYIRQANDGLSSARNRALQTARGDYVCFLDADDTRPPWAFETMMRTAQDAGRPDCVFTPGILQELRQETLPFYDTRHFMALRAAGLSQCAGPQDAAALRLALRHIACFEPQSANKMIRRDFLEQRRLRFPSGLFFEDMLFHTGLLVNLESYALTELPCFTYFRRYARPQITSTSSTLRFDAISTAAGALHLFSLSRYNQDALLRLLVLASTFKMLRWCEDSVSHHTRFAFRQALDAMIAGLEPRYHGPIEAGLRAKAEAFAPWVAPSLDYLCTALTRA